MVVIVGHSCNTVSFAFQTFSFAICVCACCWCNIFRTIFKVKSFLGGGSIGSIGRSGNSFAAYYMFIQGVFKVGVGLMEDPRAIDISSITAELNGAFALKLIGRGHWMFID